MLKGKDFLSLKDFSIEEITKLLRLSISFKQEFLTGKRVSNILKNKSLALIFEKPSTRTRVSFQVAINQLSGYSIYLDKSSTQLSRGETVSDTGKVLSRYVDGIIARVYSHQTLLELANSSTVPVINALSDLYHPCQALADLLTIIEKKGRTKGIKMAYVGDGNNVCNSLMIASSKTGINLMVATPPGYEPKQEVIELANKFSSETGSKIKVSNSPEEAVTDAEVIYTDVWISMGQEEEKDKRLRGFQGFQVNNDLLKFAKKDFIFMHCLPAHRGLEVSSDVLDDPLHSVVFDQAENRLHTEKAILSLLV